MYSIATKELTLAIINTDNSCLQGILSFNDLLQTGVI